MKREFYLTNHAFYCKSEYCKYNPEKFLFFYGTRFYIISYHDCLECGDRYGFKVNLIKQVIEKTKTVRSWDVRKSQTLCKQYKEYRLREIPLKKEITQVNYLYSDNAGKEYAITTTCDFTEAFIDNDLLKEDYKLTKEYINEKGYTGLEGLLESLYIENVFYEDSRMEQFSTLSHMIKEINSLIKQNNHKNELQNN